MGEKDKGAGLNDAKNQWQLRSLNSGKSDRIPDPPASTDVKTRLAVLGAGGVKEDCFSITSYTSRGRQFSDFILDW